MSKETKKTTKKSSAKSENKESNLDSSEVVDTTKDTADTADTQPEQAEQLEPADWQTQFEQMQEKWIRSEAECENIRKRSSEQVANAYKYSIEAFARGLLEVSDCLSMACAAEAKDLPGVVFTKNKLDDIFNQFNIMPINPDAGANFDPTLHQSIAIEYEQKENNTIIKTVQIGYNLSERTLRPASVIVSSTEKKPASIENDEQNEENN